MLSLGKARKARQREADRVRADANAIRHGRTKADRAQQALERTRTDSLLDGAHRQVAANEPSATAVDEAAPPPVAAPDVSLEASLDDTTDAPK